MTWRDEAADSGRLGSSDSPVRERALCVENAFNVPDTIASQNAQGGFNKVDQPVGGPGPQQQITHGSRGQGG